MSGKGGMGGGSSQLSNSGSNGHNSQGNHYCTRGESTASGGAYHYSNTNGSFDPPHTPPSPPFPYAWQPPSSMLTVPSRALTPL